jgi:nicotinamide N-methyltransferase
MIELQKMKETMDKMEQERAEMVAEVEAQIERALQSMAVDIDDSDYEDSRPSSRMSDNSSEHARTRKVSDASKVTMKQLRSFSTESTLAESYSGSADTAGGGSVDGCDEIGAVQSERHTGAIEEVDEDDAAVSPAKKKRFSASHEDAPQDGMTAVDEGISQKSDKIAQKVLEIQQKVCVLLFIRLYARR